MLKVGKLQTGSSPATFDIAEEQGESGYSSFNRQKFKWNFWTEPDPKKTELISKALECSKLKKYLDSENVERENIMITLMAEPDYIGLLK